MSTPQIGNRIRLYRLWSNRCCIYYRCIIHTGRFNIEDRANRPINSLHLLECQLLRSETESVSIGCGVTAVASTIGVLYTPDVSTSKIERTAQLIPSICSNVNSSDLKPNPSLSAVE